ncbi:MAG TPA: hypothetical protein VEY07_01005 [Thermoplasmata archaeon]|nr:hypothetical protein [Thermoplasmata archaeon]
MSFDAASLLGQVPWEGVFALAVVLLGIGAWGAFVRPRSPRAAVRPQQIELSDRDVVSIAYVAVQSGRVSLLVRSIRSRLNALSVTATGHTLDSLPGRLARIRRRPSVRVIALRRLRSRLRWLEWQARWAESSWLPPLDPWRPRSSSTRRLGRAVARFIGDLDRFGQSIGMNPT